jgi:DNA-binding transcriptional MerR regulator
MGYAAPVACNAAGVAYRQLDYWARTGLVEPSGTGKGDDHLGRLYTWDDVTALAVVKKLLDAGVSLQNIRRIINALREQHRDWSQITLVSDGESIFETTRDSEVIDVLNGAQAVFAVNVGSVRKQVAGILVELPGRPLA